MEEEGGLSIADTRSDNSATWRCNVPMAAVIPLNAWARSAGEKVGCSMGTVAEIMGAVVVIMATELTGVVTDGVAAEEGAVWARKPQEQTWLIPGCCGLGIEGCRSGRCGAWA